MLDRNDIQALTKAFADAMAPIVEALRGISPEAFGPVIGKAFFEVLLRGNANAQNYGSIVPVGAVSTFVIGYNAERLVATICNNSAIDVFLTRGQPAVLNSGIVIKANGGSYTFGRGTDDKYTGEIYAIVAGVVMANVMVTEINL